LHTLLACLPFAYLFACVFAFFSFFDI